MISFPDETADPINAAEKKLRQDIDDVEGKKKKRDFPKRISSERIGMFKD